MAIVGSYSIMAYSDFYQEFDTGAYLKIYDFKSSRMDRLKHVLKFYHNAFLDIPSGVSVLDYGAGPVLMSTISAATKASEIVLAEFVPSNRKALYQWLNNDSGAFDWSPHFSYVVEELEKKQKWQVRERQEQVRKLVKAVVHCNIIKSPPIEVQYNKKYDVVISSLVMEAVSSNHHEYQLNIARLGEFVKPGGKILYYGVENRERFYSCGQSKFPNVLTTADDAMKAFEKAGFKDLCFETFLPQYDPHRLFRCISGVHI